MNLAIIGKTLEYRTQNSLTLCAERAIAQLKNTRLLVREVL